MSDYIKESLNKEQPTPVSLEGTIQILYQMENCICKIHKANGVKGTGFFCKIPFKNNLLEVLITNNHVLNENEIENNKIIDISIFNKEKKEEVKKILIDKTRKKFTSPKLDVTIIEITPNKDEIHHFMDIDKEDIEKDNDLLENNYCRKSVYILHYPKENLCVSYGLINNIIDGKISHYCNTDKGSSGSPILSLENSKIIGIHYGSSGKLLNYGTFIKNAIDEFNNYYNIEYRNEINLIYNKNEEDKDEIRIFGKKFVENNKNNIELIINGKENNLIEKYKLKKGDNNIKIKIKNKLINLEYMFSECKSLKNIDELKYLNTKDVTNFSGIFYGCSSLSDIGALKNWEVSEGKNFAGIFYKCISLSNINGLEKWNVSKGSNFSYIFNGCSSLSNIDGLKYWNVSMGNYFSYTFNGCSSLSDIKSLKNWDVSNGINFSYLFSGCGSLSNIDALQNWNVSKGNNFSYMFYKCSLLSDIKQLTEWEVSNGSDFESMFCGCLSLSNINSLKNWNVLNGINFSYMFYKCSSLSDIKPLRNWNVSKGNNFSYMFKCSLISDIKPIENWNVSNKQYLKDII